MAITLHWFLPTNGDSRSDLSLGNAVGSAGSRVNPYGADRAPDLDYLRLVAGAAEKLGFTGALTPTSSWCEDAWVFTAALSQLTTQFKFLVAFRPGLQAPTLVAQAAATFQRVSGAGCCSTSSPAVTTLSSGGSATTWIRPRATPAPPSS